MCKRIQETIHICVDTGDHAYISVKCPYLRGHSKAYWELMDAIVKSEVPLRSRANVAHIRQSRPDSGIGFKVKFREMF